MASTLTFKLRLHLNRKCVQEGRDLKALVDMVYYKGSTKKIVFLGKIPKPVDPLPPLGTLRNKNVTFGQKKVGFSRPKRMATKIPHKKVQEHQNCPPLFRQHFSKIDFLVLP